ncbi:hypothetical protein CEXT_658941 [Caerostris extrusa]|uniref:RNase H type-1 domain-containing protein n=1 Tax=Caerostris extrusa TaxID=172846 RepID=A0AAV4NHM0_CAEEX|nr:hypothetical protein CEXT_658941 [Caerostris extrusa]
MNHKTGSAFVACRTRRGDFSCQYFRPFPTPSAIGPHSWKIKNKVKTVILATISIKWAKAHMGILGNEAADAMLN